MMNGSKPLSALGRAGILALFITPLPPRPALAHPHVFVTSKVLIEFKDGKVRDLKQGWTFDEMYSVASIEGLDVNKDGKYDREELKGLAKENVDGLKDYNYFTIAKLGEAEVKLGEPTDYWLEFDGKLLTLHFTQSLAEPLELKGKALTIDVEDESYFVAFQLAQEKPVQLSASAPAGCKADRKVPAPTQTEQNLSDAFGSQMDSADSEYSNLIEVKC